MHMTSPTCVHFVHLAQRRKQWKLTLKPHNSCLNVKYVYTIDFLKTGSLNTNIENELLNHYKIYAVRSTEACLEYNGKNCK
jgi:hypothetical protein